MDHDSGWLSPSRCRKAFSAALPTAVSARCCLGGIPAATDEKLGKLRIPHAGMRCHHGVPPVFTKNPDGKYLSEPSPSGDGLMPARLVSVDPLSGIPELPLSKPEITIGRHSQR